MRDELRKLQAEAKSEQVADAPDQTVLFSIHCNGGIVTSGSPTVLRFPDESVISHEQWRLNAKSRWRDGRIYVVPFDGAYSLEMSFLKINKDGATADDVFVNVINLPADTEEREEVLMTVQSGQNEFSVWTHDHEPPVGIHNHEDSITFPRRNSEHDPVRYTVAGDTKSGKLAAGTLKGNPKKKTAILRTSTSRKTIVPLKKWDALFFEVSEQQGEKRRIEQISFNLIGLDTKSG